MSDDKQGRARRVTPPQVSAGGINEPTPVAPSEPMAAAAPTLPASEPMAGTARALPQPEPVPALPAPTPATARTSADRFVSAYQQTLASIGQAQTAVASDVAAMALEIGGRTRANLTAAGDSATALLKAKSLTEMVEIQIGFARRSLDAMVETSTRLGEIGLRLASEAAKPVLGRLPG